MSYHLSFNARNASPEQIASSFIMPKHFEQVAGFRNLVLVGPRGLGKTTIMKALTASGLHFLHQRSDLKERLEKIDFSYVPIYIPAETIWRGNAQTISNSVDDEGIRNHILNGLFVDHCLHQLISSFEDALSVSGRPGSSICYPWAVDISEEGERRISNKCSSFWGIERLQHSFVGLKLALLERSNKFRAAVSSLPKNDDLNAVLKIEKQDFLLMLKGFFDIVGEVQNGLRWSICFDEMEIAPKAVLTRLYDSLRSYDQRAVLKFSLFPYADFYSFEKRELFPGVGPVAGQDFDPVVLANDFANPDYSLSRMLIENDCRAANVDFGEFSNYLNASSSILPGTRKFTSKGFGRNFEEIFAHSTDVGDRSYIEYMEKNGVRKASDVHQVRGEKRRAQVLRKPAPIAEIRSYYFAKTGNGGGTSARRASTKGFGYYHGIDQIVAITEGNPRAIKYYLNDLLANFLKNEDPSVAQNRAISRNVDRFRALAAAHALPNDLRDAEPQSTLELVDRLGNVLSERLLGLDFQPEPQLSYILKDVKPSIKPAIEVAINSGALVVDARLGSTQLIFDLEGCRVRISHRLAPFYKLPTITGQSRILSGLPEMNAASVREPDLLNWATFDE